MVYPSFLEELAAGRADLVAEEVRVLLVKGYQPDLMHSDRIDVDGEVSGPGYAQGGQALTGKTLTEEDRALVFRADPVQWDSASIEATGAVLYLARGAGASADPLVCYFDFGGSRRSRRDVFRLEWGKAGIVVLE